MVQALADVDLGDVSSPLPGGEGGLLHVDPRKLAELGLAEPDHLPYCLRVLLDNAVRNRRRLGLEAADIARIGCWRPGNPAFSLPVHVSRVLLPDSSGLPALMDLAALRSELASQGLDPLAAEPVIPVDLVVDHSLIVDAAGRPGAADFNIAREFERNGERYTFLKWAQQAFGRLSVVPPGMGIVHQIHLERLARLIVIEEQEGLRFAAPEFVLGGDSHTPMVNALGVLAWGVGGIEAEAAMLGQPYLVRVSGVVGVRLHGQRRPGVVSTDIVLSLTQRLRAHGVVGRFVEFIGPAAAALSVADRATIANMAPEYGATTGFFPIDQATIDYLRLTGRPEAQLILVEKAARACGLFREDGAREPDYSEVLDFDLAEVGASVAGPRRPQDRIDLDSVKPSFLATLDRQVAGGPLAGGLRDGAIAIAAITSCTNTSNPTLMVGAGLLAQAAAERGLAPPSWVKTSLAPGSRVVTGYLERAGLLEPLEQLGFHVVGYGCTTCSGKSGDIDPELATLIENQGLVAASVLSGNRNFEGRIHRLVKANYIMSPLLVVAYALVGFVDVDLTSEPVGHDRDGKPVYLADIWPKPEAIEQALEAARDPELYAAVYADLHSGTERWRDLESKTGAVFEWPRDSTYIVKPPFFSDPSEANGLVDELAGARILGLYGDSLTTDHICPAGEIPKDSESGRYLAERGVPPHQFNAYTQRRGNHHVMVRAIFANPRIHNQLGPDLKPGDTLLFPEQRITSIHDASRNYRERKVPVIVAAGRDYGMGSSRDWAAKGSALLGVRAVIAESFERIHRSNLVAMGILPLTFEEGEGWSGLGLDGHESFTLRGLRRAVEEGARIEAVASSADGRTIRFALHAAIESGAEGECLKAGGIFAQIRSRTS